MNIGGNLTPYGADASYFIMKYEASAPQANEIKVSREREGY
jgi:hypothetical protein